MMHDLVIKIMKSKQLFEAEKKFKLPIRLGFIGLIAHVSRYEMSHGGKSPQSEILPYDEVEFVEILETLFAIKAFEEIFPERDEDNFSVKRRKETIKNGAIS